MDSKVHAVAPKSSLGSHKRQDDCLTPDSAVLQQDDLARASVCSKQQCPMALPVFCTHFLFATRVRVLKKNQEEAGQPCT